MILLILIEVNKINNLKFHHYTNLKKTKVYKDKIVTKEMIFLIIKIEINYIIHTIIKEKIIQISILDFNNLLMQVLIWIIWVQVRHLDINMPIKIKIFISNKIKDKINSLMLKKNKIWIKSKIMNIWLRMKGLFLIYHLNIILIENKMINLVLWWWV